LDLLAYYKGGQETSANEDFTVFGLSHFNYLTLEKEAELKQNVSFKRVEPPVDLQIANTRTFLKTRFSRKPLMYGLDADQMREEMESAATQEFSLVVGKGFKGKCLEFWKSFNCGKPQPSYLFGWGIWGTTRAIIEALKGEEPLMFSDEYYFDNSDYKAMFFNF